MDMKKHRRGNEDQYLLESNEKARHRHKVAKTINESLKSTINCGKRPRLYDYIKIFTRYADVPV